MTNYIEHDFVINDSRNDDEVLDRFIEKANDFNFNIKSLYLNNSPDGNGVIFITPSKRVKGPDLMISAGFHGEEIAGPWGLLYFIEKASPEDFYGVNISFIPLLNRYGFKWCIRENFEGINCNRGFNNNVNQAKSKETLILLDNLNNLIKESKNGFLTLHEDYDSEKSYIYTYEHRRNPGIFSRHMRNELRRNFECYPDGFDEDIGDIKNGIIFNLFDGTFEDLLFRNGVSKAVCTESPGKKNLIDRVRGNSNIIKAFISFFKKE